MPIWGLMHASPEAMEETAEAYVLQRMNQRDRSSYEEHLLICRQCRDSVQTVDRFIEVFRAAVGGTIAHATR